jgi:protein-disulfide isomerase
MGAVATVVAVLVAVIGTSGGGSSAKPDGGRATTAAQRISALLAGIPESGDTLGSPTAPVTLQYYVDLECSTARAFTLGALPFIIRSWVRSGKLRIEFRSLRTVSEPKAFGVQQVAALAAGVQDKLWYYLENFYHEQGPEHTNYVTEHYLLALARQVPGLHLALWSDTRHDPQLAARVAEAEQTAHAAHLHSTPSFMVGRTGSPQTLKLGQFATLATINNVVQRILKGRSDPPDQLVHETLKAVRSRDQFQ